MTNDQTEMIGNMLEVTLDRPLEECLPFCDNDHHDKEFEVLLNYFLKMKALRDASTVTD